MCYILERSFYADLILLINRNTQHTSCTALKVRQIWSPYSKVIADERLEFCSLKCFWKLFAIRWSRYRQRRLNSDALDVDRRHTLIVYGDSSDVLNELEVDPVSGQAWERVLGVAVVWDDHRCLLVLVTLLHPHHAQPIQPRHRTRHLQQYRWLHACKSETRKSNTFIRNKCRYII